MPASPSTAPLDFAVAPAAAALPVAPVPVAEADEEPDALPLELRVPLALVLAATGTVADELTTCVLPDASVLVLTTSVVAWPVTFA